MKILLTILILFSLKVSAQDSAYWNSYNHTLYQFQQSYDGINWITIGTVRGKITDTAFVYKAPNISGGYFRVKADNVVSKTILVTSVTPVKMINVFIQNGVLNWTSENEDNLDYYSIIESTDGIHFSEINRVKATGNQTYKIKL